MADSWSSLNLTSYLAVTVHWISQGLSNQHLTLKSALIGFQRVDGKHSGANLATHILSSLDRADITLKVHIYNCSRLACLEYYF